MDRGVLGQVKDRTQNPVSPRFPDQCHKLSVLGGVVKTFLLDCRNHICKMKLVAPE